MLDRGIKSIAVVLKHAAIYPDHEEAVGKLAKKMGFEQARHQLSRIQTYNERFSWKYIKRRRITGLLTTPHSTSLVNVFLLLHLSITVVAAYELDPLRHMRRSACLQW